MPLPADVDLRSLGLAPGAITRVTVLSEQHGHAVYRVTLGERSLALKWFPDPTLAAEVRAYALLQEHRVPTLPVHGQAANALLLEDLETSPVWRLASKDDVERSAVGIAVARWYRILHAAGRRALADPRGVPEFLHREADALNATTIRDIAERLDLADNPVWQLAADHIEVLKEAMQALSETLTCNDFRWTNLALSRHETPNLQAIRFDFHLLGIGLVAGDCRNVNSALHGRARDAFHEAYSEVDEREVVLDAPVSVLYSLSAAVQRPRLPRWALPLINEVASGELRRKLERALAAL